MESLHNFVSGFTLYVHANISDLILTNVKRSHICILSCLDGFISFQVNNNFLSAGNSNREINVMKYALYQFFSLAQFLLCDMQYSFLVVFQLKFYFSTFYSYFVFSTQVLPLITPPSCRKLTRRKRRQQLILLWLILNQWVLKLHLK